MQPFVIFGLFLGSVVIGMIAQAIKGRTGVGWAALTFAIGVALWLVFEIAITLAGPEGDRFLVQWARLRQGAEWKALLFAGASFAALPTALMAFVVWTLPERRSADSYAKPMSQPGPTLERGSESRLPCPKCAEAILPAAKVCPHCRSELPVDWASPGSFQ